MEFVRAGKLYIRSFYRPPSDSIESMNRVFDSVATVIGANKNKHENILLCGDFNMPDVDWGTLQPKSDSKRKKIHKNFLDQLAESGLVQQNKLITRPRSNNVLDLICTNNPNIVSNIRTVTGVSDHLILLFDINMQPKRQSKPPHKVYTYSKADEEGLKSWLNKCNETFFQTEPNLRLSHNWNLFKKYILEVMEKFIPHQMSKGK